MKSKTIQFNVEKATKNTVRFSEQAQAGQPMIVGTLYMQKWAIPADCQRIQVTIDMPENATENLPNRA